ncbi:MAG: thiamine pyrophosphate-binding protein [Frankiales bacterium]|nr:thiamine pyrophosphate-binding protein [Frankiales bacterium]
MAYTVGDALLDQLADHGVRTCFGVPGVHNLPFWVGAGTGRRPRVLGVRHEQAAGYAADAAARATGGLGVALTTTGPGFANALAAFGEAWASRSPLLLVSSETPLAPRRRSGHDDGLLHGMRSQAAAVEHGFGARAVSARDGEQALAALPELAAHALAAGRPAYLGVPADVLASAWSGAVPGPAAPPPVGPDPAAVAAAATALRGRRVALWAGARAVAAEDDLRRLALLLGALVVPTYQARGLLADLPGTVVAPPHEPVVAAAIAACDVLLVVGDDLHGMTTRNWRMPVPGTVVALTDDEHASLGDLDLAARVTGDVATSVRALLDALGETTPTAPAPDGAALTAQVLDDVAGDPRTAAAAQFVRTVEDGWPADGALVVDMCVAGYWLGGYSRQPRARRLQYPVGWGTLGFGLPAAIGPAAHGIPTLAVVGDGGAAMGLGELATYRQERLPLALLVVSDGGYGMLRYDQDVAGDPHRGVDLVEPVWEDLARAFGLRCTRTDDPGAGLARALTQARDGLACGDQWLVVLEQRFRPPRTTSPRWREA